MVASTLVAATSIASGKRATPAEWKTYANAQFSYSFRYPADLKPARSPISKSGIVGLVDAVDLKSRSGQIVLRVLVVQANGNPMAAPSDPAFLRKVCKKYEEFRIDGRLAINCVSCGSAACNWGVSVPGATEFHILSLLTGYQPALRPTDGRYPIRSIIETFRWNALRQSTP